MSGVVGVQLDLFAPQPATPRKPKPSKPVKFKLIRQGRMWCFPTGFTSRPSPPNCSYFSSDGRWVIEANWWAGGKWCLFDTHDAAQADEANRKLTRQYYEPGIPYCDQPLPTDTGVIVKTLAEALAIIEAARIESETG